MKISEKTQSFIGCMMSEILRKKRQLTDLISILEVLFQENLLTQAEYDGLDRGMVFLLENREDEAYELLNGAGLDPNFWP